MKKLSPAIASTVLTVIVILIIVYEMLADVSSDLGDAADNITAANDVYPLTSFFKKKGVLLLAFMAGIVLFFVQIFLPSGK